MLELGRNQKIALGLAAVPSVILLLYLLFKQDDSDENEDRKGIVTSRQTVIEVNVPKKVVGAVIGRQGANIKMVQEKSGARINFNDPKSNDMDRMCVIVGDVASAAEAERLVRKLMADQAAIEEIEMYVPKAAVGRIIGRNGDTIRYLSSVSKARINVDRSNSYEETVLVTLKGTTNQIDNARGLIAEKVAESEAFRAKTACLAANRQQRGKKKSEAVQPRSSETVSLDSLRNYVCNVESVPETNNFIEVFVSAVSTPSNFWVQILRTSAFELDKLVQEMTSYYKGANDSAVEPLNVGDIVASTFPHDDLWYRARVMEILPDDEVDLYYADYGDSETVARSQVRQLRPDFLSVPLQAVECCLADVEPAGTTWSEAAIDLFEQLTHVAMWKVINAKTMNYTGTTPCLSLVDTNGLNDINISEELVKHGFAVWTHSQEGDNYIQTAQEPAAGASS